MFVADIAAASTALVVIGAGDDAVLPRRRPNSGQVRIFCGTETLETRFDVAFIRVNPSEFATPSIAASTLAPRTGGPGECARARRRSSRTRSAQIVHHRPRRPQPRAWSLLPRYGDSLAEVRTRAVRHADLRAIRRPRPRTSRCSIAARKRNISLYPSQRKLAQRGARSTTRTTSSTTTSSTTTSTSFDPGAPMDRRPRADAPQVRAYALGDADAAARRSAGRPVGRQLRTRAPAVRFACKNQNSVVVNLPTTLRARHDADADASRTAGRLEPQAPDREAIARRQAQRRRRAGARSAGAELPLQQPQLLVSAGTGQRLRDGADSYDACPRRSTCVASGELPRRPVVATRPRGRSSSSPISRSGTVFDVGSSRCGRRSSTSRSSRERRRRRRSSTQRPAPPARRRMTPTAPEPTGVRLRRARPVDRGEPAAGDARARAAPTACHGHRSVLRSDPRRLAVSELHARAGRERPAGRPQPGVFRAAQPAAADAPLTCGATTRWRSTTFRISSSPTSSRTSGWGQAVGWKNYHEQWLSEGFAQYFAALYAQQQRGDGGVRLVLRQMRRWALEQSDQGPIWLGYRLGPHPRRQPRCSARWSTTRARGAAHAAAPGRRRGVLPGLRTVLRDARFQKAGTEELRAAIEAETGRSLERFFERWIYGADDSATYAWQYDFVPGGVPLPGDGRSTAPASASPLPIRPVRAPPCESRTGQVRVTFEQMTDQSRGSRRRCRSSMRAAEREDAAWS